MSSWNHLFGGMMSQVGFNPGGIAFPPNAQIVSVQQNLAQQQQHQQQQQQQSQQQQIKREAPGDGMGAVGTTSSGTASGGSSANSSAASAAAAAAAAAASMEFLTTIATKELLEELKVQSQAIVHKTISNGTDGKQLIKHYRCNRHRHQEKCPFKMLAIQSDDGTFRVYKTGDHNHAVVPSGRATGNPRTNWIPMQTVRTTEELETLRQAQRVTVHKTTFHGKNRHFRCNRHRHNERCMFKLLAVTENNDLQLCLLIDLKRARGRRPRESVPLKEVTVGRSLQPEMISSDRMPSGVFRLRSLPHLLFPLPMGVILSSSLPPPIIVHPSFRHFNYTGY
uniref:FLYWCH-type domain-containing protein n=1 Tax=Globodera rostochiensis TaxID=31243 RepID=A0A914I5K5_GLORO